MVMSAVVIALSGKDSVLTRLFATGWLQNQSASTSRLQTVVLVKQLIVRWYPDKFVRTAAPIAPTANNVTHFEMDQDSGHVRLPLVVTTTPKTRKL
jgi:hypothetical protein